MEPPEIVTRSLVRVEDEVTLLSNLAGGENQQNERSPPVDPETQAKLQEFCEGAIEEVKKLTASVPAETRSDGLPTRFEYESLFGGRRIPYYAVDCNIRPETIRRTNDPMLAPGVERHNMEELTERLNQLIDA